ncbi:MAG: hypothetical protein MJK14_03150 [Rivularia sp. ALOHA_DT_140]|nr:hypothetical protein [Rivularia sp. ALOHA_DT_140]
MKRQMLFGIITCISLLTSFSVPVIAETIPSETESSNTEEVTNLEQSTPASDSKPASSITQLQNAKLAKNTAIIISFPMSMEFNIKGSLDLPLTVLLAKPITDNQGNILVSENSPVSIILKPTKKGAQIIAQSLVANGKVFNIKASSPIIPGVKVTHKTGTEKA